MSQILGGDQAYTNLITKNPFHKSFRSTFISLDPYSLDDLAKPAIRAFGKLKSRHEIKAKATGIGRNEDLFETLRHWAYRAVHEFRENSNYVGWFNEVTAQAAGINCQFNPPLPDNEVRHTVKSVADWVWTRYFGSGGKRRGIMNLENAGVDLELTDKQSMGAQFAAKVKVDANRNKIINAIGILTGQGQRITKAAVARLTGLHRNTLTNYQDLFR